MRQRLQGGQLGQKCCRRCYTTEEQETEERGPRSIQQGQNGFTKQLEVKQRRRGYKHPEGENGGRVQVEEEEHLCGRLGVLLLVHLQIDGIKRSKDTAEDSKEDSSHRQISGVLHAIDVTSE